MKSKTMRDVSLDINKR